MKVSIVGTGNVAASLVTAFILTKQEIVSIHGRDKKSRDLLCKNKTIKSCSLQAKVDEEVDVVIIAVSDDSISLVSSKLNISNPSTIICHTSGSKPISVLSSKDRSNPIGVFYPLQTIRKDAKMDFSFIPICIISNDSEALDILMQLGKSLSSNVLKLDDAGRLKAHVAAVIINNFTNHIVSSAYTYLEENEIPISIVQPLLQETVAKLLKDQPDTTQTGPAKRGDIKVIEDHLSLLKETDLHDIYNTMSNSILNKYHSK